MLLLVTMVSFNEIMWFYPRTGLRSNKAMLLQLFRTLWGTGLTRTLWVDRKF
ncbi:MAG: hypothetical protein CM15mV49_030 [uncultured marine virus]|nr:MAG: hypothetical protein CM15mV49_030 [uncultured marine virus]